MPVNRHKNRVKKKPFLVELKKRLEKIEEMLDIKPVTIQEAWDKMNKSLKVHKHSFRQKGIFDASKLLCDCGMVLVWNAGKKRYEEEEE